MATEMCLCTRWAIKTGLDLKDGCHVKIQFWIKIQYFKAGFWHMPMYLFTSLQCDCLSLLSMLKLTLSLYSTLSILQFRIEMGRLGGMGSTLVTVLLGFGFGSIGSPSSLKRSCVWSFLFPLAKKLCFSYKQYFGLIVRDELFWTSAKTFKPSPVVRHNKTLLCKIKFTWIIPRNYVNSDKIGI